MIERIVSVTEFKATCLEAVVPRGPSATAPRMTAVVSLEERSKEVNMTRKLESIEQDILDRGPDLDAQIRAVYVLTSDVVDADSLFVNED